MSVEIHRIKEIFPNVFWVLLDCPKSDILLDLLNPDVPYVLCWDHSTGDYSWQQYRLPLTTPDSEHEIYSRILKFDFLISTQEFISLLPEMSAGIKMVQIRQMPPDYLDLSVIQGRERYRLLSECGWELELRTPGNDSGELLSPNRELLERAIELDKTDAL